LAPPSVSFEALQATLDRLDSAEALLAAPTIVEGSERIDQLGGNVAMNDAESAQSPLGRGFRSSVSADSVVSLAQVPGGCGCGGGSGACSCKGGLAWPVCANAGSNASNYVYVLGTVDVCAPDQSIADELLRIGDSIGVKQGKGTGSDNEYDVLLPNDGAKKEISCVIDREEDLRSWVYRVLTHPQGMDARYIVKQLRWILRVEGLPAYYLCLTDTNDLDDLIKLLREPLPEGLNAAVRNAKSPLPIWPNLNRESAGHDLCQFIGTSSLIPAEASPGIEAPILNVDYMCAHELRELESWLVTSGDKSHAPKPKTPSRPFLGPHGGHSQNELFKRLVQSADNFGHTDEWRALNFLAVQYPKIYNAYADMLEAGFNLVAIRVIRSRLGGRRRIVDPVFVFRHADGAVEKYFVRVDVTYRFPSIVSHLAEYFDR
jgi:hypothetical protein